MKRRRRSRNEIALTNENQELRQRIEFLSKCNEEQADEITKIGKEVRNADDFEDILD